MCFKNVFLAESSPTNSCNYNVDHHYGGSPDSMGPASTPFYDSYSYYGDYSDPQVTDLLNGYDFPCGTTVPSTPLTHQLHLEQQNTSPMSFSSDSSPPNFHEHYSQRYTPSSTSRPTTLSANRPVYNGFASPPEYAYRVPPNPDGHLPSFLQIMQGLDGYSPGGGGADLDIKGFAVPPSTNLGGNGGATSPLQQQSICKVCGDVASGNHFGVLSCEACKSFFRRSVRAGARYACRSSRGCTIEKHTRNRCQYCRLQKCMQMGMRKEAVQEERAPPVSKLQRAGTPTQLGYTPPAPNYSIASIPHLPMQSSYRSFDSPVSPIAPTNLISQSRMFGSLPNLKMGMDSQPLTPPSLSYDMYSNNGSRPVTPTPPNTTMGSGTAMYPPDCTLGGIPGNNNQANQVSATVLVNADIQTDLPPENVTTSDHGVKLEDIFEGARQSLLRVIEWGKRIPAFTGLSLDDQVKLLKSCWCEHVLLKLATRIGPRSETLLLSSGITCRKDQIEDPEIRRIVDRISHEISYWFDVMHVDRVEMACLKGIILFNPDARGLSPGTRKRVEIFQEQILSALESRCRSLYPVTPLRFSKLLLRLPPLRSAALEATQHMEVQRTLGNTKMDNIFSELLDFD